MGVLGYMVGGVELDGGECWIKWWSVGLYGGSIGLHGGWVCYMVFWVKWWRMLGYMGCWVTWWVVGFHGGCWVIQGGVKLHSGDY